MAADYTRVPARYAGANLFFTSGFGSDLHRKVQNSSIARHLRKLDQLYIDFKPLESHTFSLKDPYALEKFYNDGCVDLLQQALHKMALQLVSLCATLEEYPIIRFYEADNTSRLSRKLPYMLAKEFQQELDEYARTHADFPDTSENRPRSVFLILDRTIDWLAPLLHEFTYQATAYDLLPMKHWSEFKYTENIMGEQQPAEGKLSEKDPEWVSLRHTHMEKATVILGEKLEKLKKDNPHLADATMKANITDLKDMMLNLPLFNEMRSRYTLHVAMASECMSLIGKRNLIDLAIIEQICATRTVDDDKTKPKGLADEVVAMLADERLEAKDKVRLIILYAIYRGGLVEADYAKLRQHCKLSGNDITVIYNFVKLGAPILKSMPRDRISKKDLPTRFDSHATGEYLPMSRYVPAVYSIVDSLIKGTLPSSLFPYIKDQPTDDEDGVDYNSVSLRNPRQRAVWARSGNTQVIKQRVFVFMAGGMTASETRCCYELAKLHPKDIVIGGSDFTAGPQFLKSLYRLNLPRNQLGLEEDKPRETQAPKHLYESERDTRKAKEEAAAKAANAQKQNQLKGKPQAAHSSSSGSAEVNTDMFKKDKKRGKLSKFFK